MKKLTLNVVKILAVLLLCSVASASTPNSPEEVARWQRSDGYEPAATTSTTGQPASPDTQEAQRAHTLAGAEFVPLFDSVFMPEPDDARVKDAPDLWLDVGGKGYGGAIARTEGGLFLYIGDPPTPNFSIYVAIESAVGATPLELNPLEIDVTKLNFWNTKPSYALIDAPMPAVSEELHLHIGFYEGEHEFTTIRTRNGLWLGLSNIAAFGTDYYIPVDWRRFPQ